MLTSILPFATYPAAFPRLDDAPGSYKDCASTYMPISGMLRQTFQPAERPQSTLKEHEGRAVDGHLNVGGVQSMTMNQWSRRGGVENMKGIESVTLNEGLQIDKFLFSILPSPSHDRTPNRKGRLPLITTSRASTNAISCLLREAVTSPTVTCISFSDTSLRSTNQRSYLIVPRTIM